ncbi:hypothetical protein JB92DRAFT_2288512 [Gautieria morchelliformis]|nr:hypothetical protein JB92DRAFT_2288512 [Gautieria morchelliformis]
MDRMTTRDISRRFTPSQALAFPESFRLRLLTQEQLQFPAPPCVGSPPTLHMKIRSLGRFARRIYHGLASSPCSKADISDQTPPPDL